MGHATGGRGAGLADIGRAGDRSLLSGPRVFPVVSMRDRAWPGCVRQRSTGNRSLTTLMVMGFLLVTPARRKRSPWGSSGGECKPLRRVVRLQGAVRPFRCVADIGPRQLQS